MAEDTEQLRADIDQQRAAISSTVDQIENRMSPSRIVARRQDRVRHTLSGWKETIFGQDTTMPPSAGYALGYESSGGEGGGAVQAVRDRAGSAVETLADAADMARRQTQGNPVVAGAVALGVGWLIGSLMPESRKERELAQSVEPKLAAVASAVKDEGQQMVEDLKEPAQDAMQNVKEAGREATSEIADSGRTAAQNVKEQAGS